MLKKSLSIALIFFMLLALIIFLPENREERVVEVKSPLNIQLENGEFVLDGLDTFDDRYSEHNKILANALNITEIEAFILGNFAKYYAKNLLEGRNVYINDNDLVYYRYSYRDKFFYSAFCVKDMKPCSQSRFEKQLKSIRRSNYKVIDLDTRISYSPNDDKIKNLKNFIIEHAGKEKPAVVKPVEPQKRFDKGNVKIFFTDLTTKLKPDRNCSSSICKEILYNIDKADSTIDMAIYGYSRVPAIENALLKAKSRGVKIRLVYDLDSKGRNIYEDTNAIVKLIPSNMSDLNSPDAGNIMHNKFYIFDDKVLITGSANLSHTDMSGFNSNCIVVVDSKEAALIYKTEFEQMFSGKFHTEKVPQGTGVKELNLNNIKMRIYFSPQDKNITNAVLPLIRNAKKYIYIPTFVLTEKRVTEELIKAKKRGVDVKIIIDALNASGRHSKHGLLREGGVLVKTENYAGKMHSKSMIVDDEYVLVGSMNFSYSGENKNDENLIVIKDSDMARIYRDFFLYQWNKIDNKWLKFNARAEGLDSIGSCFDGIDNNYDGLKDAQDPACSRK